MTIFAHLQWWEDSLLTTRSEYVAAMRALLPEVNSGSCSRETLSAFFDLARKAEAINGQLEGLSISQEQLIAQQDAYAKQQEELKRLKRQRRQELRRLRSVSIQPKAKPQRKRPIRNRNIPDIFRPSDEMDCSLQVCDPPWLRRWMHEVGVTPFSEMEYMAIRGFRRESCHGSK